MLLTEMNSCDSAFALCPPSVLHHGQELWGQDKGLCAGRTLWLGRLTAGRLLWHPCACRAVPCGAPRTEAQVRAEMLGRPGEREAAASCLARPEPAQTCRAGREGPWRVPSLLPAFLVAHRHHPSGSLPEPPSSLSAH